jgi:HAD superfamily hydrolase (TIGR01509 family)
MNSSLDIARIQALCLDIDGTLVDSDDRLAERFTRLLQPMRFLFRERDPSAFARRLVMAAETPFNAVVVLADRLGLDGLVIPMLERISGQSRRRHEAPLIQGVGPALEILRARYRLAIVTARTQRSTDAFLDDHGLRSHFECVASARTCDRAKPHPAPLLWAAEQMGIPVEACLMVGDTPIDVRTGVAAGAQTVGVLCGFGQKDELERAGANLILDSTAELPAALNVS